jgi:hypothetical protein
LAMLADDLSSPAREPAANDANTASEAVTLTAPALPLPLPLPLQRLQLLPALARFFGREAEMAELGRWLRTERLITLLVWCVTLIATEVARREAAHYAVIAFVALADCTRPDELASRVRAALRLPDGPGDAVEKINFYLQGQPALLVLDNFDQLVSAAAVQMLEPWLHSLPELQLLVTSPRVLDAEGERSFEAAPLPLPGETLSLIECAANPSVALFIDRARAARAGFHLHEGSRADADAAVWSSLNAQVQDGYAVLSRLIADSLVLSETGLDGRMRYRLFEMVREFVEERLSPTDCLLMRARQRDWFIRFAQAHARALPLSEVPNLHQALRSSLEDDQPLCVLTLSLATESHWDRRGVPPEVRSLWFTALDALR